MMHPPVACRASWVALLLVGALLLAGCGGSSGGGGRRLSDVVAEDEPRGREAQRESRTRGDESRSRTPTDHQDRPQTEDRYDADSGSGGSGDVVSWLFSALFSGGDDDDNAEQETSRAYGEYAPSSPYVEGEVGGSDPDAADGSDLSLGLFSLGYRQSWSSLAGDAVEGFRTGMVAAGLGPKNGTKIYLGFYFGHGDFQRSDVGNALDDLSETGLELGVRAYLTPDHTLVGPYLLVGGRFGSTEWKYREPQRITGQDGGVTWVTEDYVIDGGPFLGAGVSILQTRRLHLGASFMTGVRFRKGTTNEGFENDLFRNVGWYQWNLEGSIRF